VHLTYESYFGALATLFKEVDRGDEIFMVGWNFDLSAALVPGESALSILQGAAKKGARIRILTNGDRRVQDPGAEVLADHQVLDNHHQKAVYVRAKGEQYLFVGGMDIDMGFSPNPRGGYWFDAQAELRGAAALLGKQTLEERWASVKGIKWGFPFFEFGQIEAAEKASNPQNAFCQFVRTYPEQTPPRDSNGRLRSYASDMSYGRLLMNFLTRGKRSIYIEDQFFLKTTLLDPYLRIAVLRGMSLVVVTARKNHIDNMDHGPVVKYISAGIPKNRLHFFQMKESPPPKPHFVHAKTWIVDDEAVLVGSSNYWNNSFNGRDTEFGVALVSSAKTNNLSFGHDLRVRMWNRLIAASPGTTALVAKSDMVSEIPALAAALEPL
jgi:phosphatidylserine/phosphatidylglycerophosphate/cardiolipin synthase-like enzyme